MLLMCRTSDVLQEASFRRARVQILPDLLAYSRRTAGVVPPHMLKRVAAPCSPGPPQAWAPAEAKSSCQLPASSASQPHLAAFHFPLRQLNSFIATLFLDRG